MSTHRNRAGGHVRKTFASSMAAAIAAIVGLALAPSPALAAPTFVPVDGATVYVGEMQVAGTGFFPVWEQTPADLANPGEPDFYAYCIEHHISARGDADAQVSDPDGFLGNNLFEQDAVQAKVLWVLAHGYPAVDLEDLAVAAGIPSISRDDAVRATQYAVWRYTDVGYDAEWNWDDPNGDDRELYWYLVDSANASAGLLPSDFDTTVSVTAPSAEQKAKTLVGPFLVHTNQPSAKLTVDPAYALVDVDGNVIDAASVVDSSEVYLDISNSGDAGEATVAATVDGSSATGFVLNVSRLAGDSATAGDHAQSLILVAANGATTRAEAAVRWSAVEEPSVPGEQIEDDSNEQREDDSKKNNGSTKDAKRTGAKGTDEGTIDRLPNTGGEGTSTLVAGGLLVVATGTALLLRRRIRIFRMFGAS